MKDIMIEILIIFLVNRTDASIFRQSFHVRTVIEIFTVRRDSSNNRWFLLLLLQPLVIVACLYLV